MFSAIVFYPKAFYNREDISTKSMPGNDSAPGFFFENPRYYRAEALNSSK